MLKSGITYQYGSVRISVRIPEISAESDSEI